MPESNLSLLFMVPLLAFGLLTTFPQIHSWQRLCFWLGVVLLLIPAYVLALVLLKV